jgi:NAD(P) transhydrogenase subunit alpha
MSDAYKQKQAELIHQHAVAADIIITTALIPGRPAPVLITAEAVGAMKPGSVIVDMAVEMGGNCPLSEMDSIWQKDGVTLIGISNIPALMAADSSSLYARNLFNFVALMLDPEKEGLNIDMDDEIVEASLLCWDGEVMKPQFFGGDSVGGEV